MCLIVGEPPLHISVYNATNWQKKHVKNFAIWFARKYIPVQTSNFLNLMVRVHNKFMNDDGVSDAAGFCEIVQERQIGKPWKFKIAIASNPGTSKYQFMARLAHEMTHVKQQVKHELRYADDGSAMFKHMHFPDEMVNVGDDGKYYDLPWEIEAHGMEYGCVKQYCEYAGIKDEVLPFSVKRHL